MRGEKVAAAGRRTVRRKSDIIGLTELKREESQGNDELKLENGKTLKILK